MLTPSGIWRSFKLSSGKFSYLNPLYRISLNVFPLYRLKDIEWVEKKLDALKKVLRGATGTANLADKAKKLEVDTVAKVLDTLTVQNKDVRKGTWNNKEIDIINELQLLTSKPVTYLVNLSEKDYIRKKNKW